ncbi:unnamed protein product [Prunus armeniaca]|uniref:Uncharacterized protein n=1 Tax=Prunus armeniaca TaxID=36596 RepID=A0A6J5UMI5_PRUAR|nr:unnamed protein product [Prunus armeniaca]
MSNPKSSTCALPGMSISKPGPTAAHDAAILDNKKSLSGLEMHNILFLAEGAIDQLWILKLKLTSINNQAESQLG